MKFSIVNAKKILWILHGRVFVMKGTACHFSTFNSTVVMVYNILMGYYDFLTSWMKLGSNKLFNKIFYKYSESTGLPLHVKVLVNLER